MRLWWEEAAAPYEFCSCHVLCQECLVGIKVGNRAGNMG